MTYAIAIALIVFGPLLIVACLRVGVEPVQERPEVLR